MPVSFSLLLNLAAVCSAETADELWGYIQSYAPSATPQTHPHLGQLAGYAVRFYQDRVRPDKKYRNATAEEKTCIAVCGQPWPNCRKMPKQAMYKAWSMLPVKSVTRICATGLNACMKPCLARNRARVWAVFSAFMACQNPSIYVMRFYKIGW